ncbi:putative holin-like toxin [Paenibacillus sp. NPDC093718]
MEVKDALTIMFLFGSSILALLTYLIITTRESKNPP